MQNYIESATKLNLIEECIITEYDRTEIKQKWQAKQWQMANL